MNRHQRNINTSIILTAAAIACGATKAAFADADESGRRIDTLLAESDLAIRGEVIDIEYALSQPTGPDDAEIPYTFVTYEVHDIYRGEAPEIITLKFLGGHSQRNGLFMHTSVTPLFDLGDEDILFVTGNTEEFCPLVNDTNGRLRVINGKVYTENGNAIEMSGDCTLHIGDKDLLEEVMTHEVMGEIMVKNLGPEAKTGESDAMSAEELSNAIAAQAALMAAPTTEYVNADAGEPFEGPDMTPAAPPAANLAQGEGMGNPPASEGFRPVKRR